MGLHEEGPNPIDIHVGGRIRMRRRILSLSQEKLAEALGLTFQQVQKYERGANRVSASKLWQICHALQCPITYFFQGLTDPITNDTGEGFEASITEFATDNNGITILQAWGKMGHQGKAALGNVAKALVPIYAQE